MTLSKTNFVLTAAILCLFQPAISKETNKTDSINAQSQADNSAARLTSNQEPIRDVLRQFQSAINSGDVEQALNCWSDSAILVDATGNTTSGRTDLKARLSQNLDGSKGRTIGIHPERITFPASNVALVIGDVSRQVEDKLLPQTRFSMVLEKQDNKWKIAQATETKIDSPQANNSQHLDELSWLLGSWHVSSPGNSNAKLDVSWDENKTFLRSKCTKQNGAAKPEVDYQIIGWDPQKQCIVSWHFDCHGGFGYGRWHKLPEGWAIDFAGISGDGESAQARNIFKFDGKNSMSWQSAPISSDGSEDTTEAETATLVRDN